MYEENKKCRICGNANLVSVLDLGKQYLTGLFPKTKTGFTSSGPLELVKCHGQDNVCCGLLQLKHTYEPAKMYGENYGYRSGLNRSMVEHLYKKARKIEGLVRLSKGDLVVDIGSNDGTLLKAYPTDKYILVGIDPVGQKFGKYYPPHIQLISDFFSSKIIKKNFGRKKAKIITSIAMFYDLDSPMEFMRQIHEVLADDGVWVFEQSYMPTMLKINAYDTICHEHLEYYGFKQIKWMTDRIGFKIIDIELNEINGGSFSVAVAKSDSVFKENKKKIGKLLEEERRNGLDTLKPYEAFKKKVFKHRDTLLDFIEKVKSEGEVIFGYGASTKGNVILQFCKLTQKDIPFIAEVNKDKFGCLTPGSFIPIISEEEARAKKPDYFMVLPWHFRENIIGREKKFLQSSGRLIFPLPSIEVYP